MKKLTPYLMPLLIIAAFYIGRKIYFTPAYHSGEVAPNFQGVKTDGNSFELKDLQGNYVLLEFWGSWCGDCRQSHPQLKEIYNQFHDQKYKDANNFEVVSVALETNEKYWKRAIEMDQLNWEYHSLQIAQKNSEMFNQPLAVEYGIKWLPSSFLLDPKGQIIKVNPSKSYLEEFLNNQKI